MELRSLYREPEAREQLSFGALEFHDVFRIFRSGPAETVALRGLDLRVEPRALVARHERRDRRVALASHDVRA